MNSKIGIMIVSGIFVGSAYAAVVRAPVAMKINDPEAHICVGKEEVKVGDKFTAYKNECTPGKGKVAVESGTELCKKVKLGDAKIEKLLNEHYALLKFEPGVKFDERSFVESSTK